MQFTIRERNIKCTNDQLIGDNADYTASFSFDAEWAGKVKTARFIHGGNHVDKILENDACIIPVEVLKHGFIKVGVFSSEMTTTFCEVYIRESIKEKNGSPIAPTPDVYAQIIDMIEDIEQGEIPQESIAEAVAEYLTEHPIETLTEDDVDQIVAAYVAAHRAELKGDKGDKGDNGTNGADGADGSNGVDGADGADGASAYDIAVANGFEGTQQEWLASLKGAKGDTGETGAKGDKGDTGDRGSDGAKGDTGAKGDKGDKGDQGDQGESGLPVLQTVTVSGGISTQALDANTFYLFSGAVTQLTVTLNAAQGYAEYIFAFTTDNTCILTVPTSVKWDGGSDPTLEANKYYEVSILNNVAVISQGVAV